MKFLSLSLLICISFLTVACDGGSSSPSTTASSSYAVGGESSTMAECKERLDKTASKYNVSYTVKSDERDYFSGRVVKDGVETDLMVLCKKENDFYSGMFEVPN